MKFNDLADIKSIPEPYRTYILNYFKEPLAFRVPAESGWRAVVCLREKSDNVIVDAIPFYEWGFFSSFTLYDKGLPSFVKHHQEATMPIIPSGYNGALADYFQTISDTISNWHRIPVPFTIVGCLPPSDLRSFHDIEKLAKSHCDNMDIREKSVTSLEESLEKTIESIFGASSTAVDKSKLN